MKVPEYQQLFIKFLWWESDNIEEEPSDFAMCAHVLGMEYHQLVVETMP